MTVEGGNDIVKSITDSLGGVGKALGVTQATPKTPKVKDYQQEEKAKKAEALKKARARERQRSGQSKTLLTGGNSGFDQLQVGRKTLLGK